MYDSKFRRRLGSYLLAKEFREIAHPLEPFNRSRCVELTDAENAVKALLALLQMLSRDSAAESVERDVRCAFEEYWEASNAGHRAMAARQLAIVLEPFLRKIYAERYGIPTDNSFRQLLKDVALYQGDFLRRPTDEQLVDFLKGQNTIEAILHDAYHARNLKAHKAKKLTTFEELRYWNSVVAAFLLTADKNKDLVPEIREHIRSTARISSGLLICLGNVRDRFRDERWRNEFYIPLTIDRGTSLDKHVFAFLESTTDRLLIIAGRTGAGKSTFLERLVTELADQAIGSLDSERADQLFIPVHYELKRHVPGKRTYLLKKLYNDFDPGLELGIKTRRVAIWPQVLSPRCLVICLDGLDEVPSTAYATVISEIEELGDFDNVKVIVTSRPHAVPSHWHGSLVRIMPLPQEEVIAYFGHPERLNLLASEVQTFLAGRPDLVEILQDPLMAEAACRYWREFESPNWREGLDQTTRQAALLEGPLLKHLYKCLFTHHLHRAFGVGIIDYEGTRQVAALAELALKMDGAPFADYALLVDAFDSFERGTTTREDLSAIFINIGLITLCDNKFAFRNDTVKAYFAAVGLLNYMRSRQSRERMLSLIGQADQFWHRCVALLKQIAVPSDDFGLIEGHLASLAEA